VLFLLTRLKGCVDGKIDFELNVIPAFLSFFLSYFGDSGIFCIRVKMCLTQKRTPKAKAKIEKSLTLRHEGMGSK